MQQNVNRNNRKAKTGENTWTWESLTTPLHYFTAQRFLECEHRTTRAVPELFSLCRRRIFHILRNFKRIAQIDELPLPKTLLDGMKILLPAALYIHQVKNPAHDCRGLLLKQQEDMLPSNVNYSKILTSKNEGDWHTFPMSGSSEDTPTAHWMRSPLCDPPEQIFVNRARDMRRTSFSTLQVEFCRNNNVS